VLGPKYGKRLPAIRQALAGLDPAAVAETVQAGRAVELALPDGSVVALEPAEVLVDMLKQPGFAAARGPGATVVLDTTLTPALVAEGVARDFVRGVQDARKDAGFQIEDRIAVVYRADPAVTAAVATHAAHVAAETLAVELAAADGADLPTGDGWHQQAIRAGDGAAEVALRRLTL
jgi:isoleucyl-tRNA synthetase